MLRYSIILLSFVFLLSCEKPYQEVYNQIEGTWGVVEIGYSGTGLVFDEPYHFELRFLEEEKVRINASVYPFDIGTFDYKIEEKNNYLSSNKYIVFDEKEFQIDKLEAQDMTLWHQDESEDIYQIILTRKD